MEELNQSLKEVLVPLLASSTGSICILRCSSIARSQVLHAELIHMFPML